MLDDFVENLEEKSENLNAGHRQRLLSQILTNREEYSNVELIEMLLYFAIPRKDTKLLAKKILLNYNSLNAIFSAPDKELINFEGLGKQSVFLIKLIFLITKSLINEKIQKRDILSSMDNLIQYTKITMASISHEELRVILLDAKNHIIANKILIHGNVSGIQINLRDIVKFCLSYATTSIILIHNHPSQDPVPSKEDIEFTQNIKNFLLPLSITLLDHLIIGGSNYYSFFQNNLI